MKQWYALYVYNIWNMHVIVSCFELGDVFRHTGPMTKSHSYKCENIFINSYTYIYIDIHLFFIWCYIYERRERGSEGRKARTRARAKERKRGKRGACQWIIFHAQNWLILEKDPKASCRLIMTGISNTIFFLFSCFTGSIMQQICWITFCAKLSCWLHRAILWVRWQGGKNSGCDASMR